MQKHARLIDLALSPRQMGRDGHCRLFDELLAVFETACGLEKPELAAGLLALLDASLGAEELLDPDNLPRLERLVEARYRLLEVKFTMHQRGGRAG